jgi:hypothetical protein
MTESTLRQNIKSRRKIVATIIGMTIFAGGAIYSSYEISKTEVTIDYRFISPVLFLAAVSALLSAFRFQISGLLFKVKIPYKDAIAVISYGTLANLLPIPGALIIRFEYLRRKTGAQRSTFIQIMGILVWFTVGSILLVTITTGPYKILALTMSAATLLSSTYLAWQVKTSKVHLLILYLVQASMTLVNIAKLWLIFSILSLSVSLSLPTALAITDIVTSTSAVIPSGIGISETAAATVTAFFEVHPSIGFVVASLNRVSMWATLLALLILVKLCRGNERKQEEYSK